MKKITFLFTLIFSFSFIKAQTTFFKTIGGYDESSNYIEQTTDGGFVIVGTSPTSGTKGYVVKTNSIGDTIWTKLYGGTYATFNSGKQTSDGGYILLGSIGYSTLSDIYVLKIDSIGSIQWQKNIGGSAEDIGTQIKQTSDGGYIVSGYGKSYGAGNDDVYIIKLDLAGNIQWNNVLGSASLDQGYSIEETSDGGYIAIGTSGANSYLLKLNSFGILQWSKTFGESSFFYKGKGVFQTSDDGYMILGGRRNSASVVNDVTLIKTDSLGNINWSKVYGGAIADNDFSFSKTVNGNFIIASSTNSQVALLYTLVDSTGNMIWSRFVNGIINHGSFASETTDGGYVFTGYLKTAAAGGIIYFIKADSLGRSGCIDSSATLTTNPFVPIINAPIVSTTSGIAIATPIVFIGSIGRTMTTSCTSVGIYELTSSPKVFVYPNPSSDQFNFTGLGQENRIEIFNALGQLVFQIMTNNDFQTINIGNREKGIYFYRIIKDTKLVQQGKIILSTE